MSQVHEWCHREWQPWRGTRRGVEHEIQNPAGAQLDVERVERSEHAPVLGMHQTDGAENGPDDRGVGIDPHFLHLEVFQRRRHNAASVEMPGGERAGPRQITARRPSAETATRAPRGIADSMTSMRGAVSSFMASACARSAIAGRRVGTNQHTQRSCPVRDPTAAPSDPRTATPRDRRPASSRQRRRHPNVPSTREECARSRGPRPAVFDPATQSARGDPSAVSRRAWIGFVCPSSTHYEPVCCRVPDLGRRAGERRSAWIADADTMRRPSAEMARNTTAPVSTDDVGSMMRRCHVPAAHGAIPGRRKDARPGGRHGHGSH